MTRRDGGDFRGFMSNFCRRRRGSKGVEAHATQAEARIIPTLGRLEVDKLTAKRISDWLGDLADAPRRVRTPKIATVHAFVSLTETTARKSESDARQQTVC
jgi:hypothetical protein